MVKFSSSLGLMQCGQRKVHQTYLCSEVMILEEHSDEVWCLQFSHNGRYLASSSRDRSAILWEGKEKLGQVHGHPVDCGKSIAKLMVKFSSSLGLMQCGQRKVHQTYLCSEVMILEEHSDEVWCLQFSHNGRYLASSSRDRSAILWEVILSSSMVTFSCLIPFLIP
ncbi:unnamed protein product [Ilex paraguariensis]|uniref:Uncharacterized protein n=1 Tax=Ilex paraguariensis TaxID=185542 RepID=A0ABC8QKR4_9AQUA